MGKTFGVVGGDDRQKELAVLLRRDGHTVFTYGLGEETPIESALGAPVVILPLPLEGAEGMLNCREGEAALADVFAALRPEQRILGGQMRPAHWEMAKGHRLSAVDYFRRETLTVANAAITADCALDVAAEALKETLGGKNCLVLGFGRIGKLLCHRLQRLDCRVTAAARKAEDLAWIRAYGYEGMDMAERKGQLDPFDVVFNTVPQPVFTGAVPLPAGTKLYIELASRPGLLPEGNTAGAEVIAAASLPGKYAPRAAGCAIAAVLQRCIHAERKEHP